MGQNYNDLLFPEAIQIDHIRTLEARYAIAHGIGAFDVSHWNAGADFSAAILPYLNIPPSARLIEYIYSEELPLLSSVAQRLGVLDSAIALTPSATASSMLMACFLQRVKISRIHLMAPHYFASKYALALVGIQTNTFGASPTAAGFTFEKPSNIYEPESEAIWLTDPLFTTGIYWDDREITIIRDLLERGCWIIADQVLATPGLGLHQKLGSHPRVLSIHSPHKYICVNGLKFSAIAHHPSLTTVFAHWPDVVFGGLSVSNSQAVDHFLSPDFNEAIKKVTCWNEAATAFLLNEVRKYPGVTLKEKNPAVFTSCFFPHLPRDFADSPDNFWRIINETGASFIPGSRNAMPPTAGFSFRVNLARDSALFRGAVVRLIRYLAQSRV